MSETHGGKSGGKTRPSYRSWQMMKNRCLNKRSPDYSYYGARGITICPEWVASYSAFIRDMGEPPESYTLERVDGNKGYYPDNCVWAPRKTQSRNREYCSKYSFHEQELHTWEWAEKLGISQSTFYYRVWKHKRNPEGFPYHAIFEPYYGLQRGLRAE